MDNIVLIIEDNVELALAYKENLNIGENVLIEVLPANLVYMPVQLSFENLKNKKCVFLVDINLKNYSSGELSDMSGLEYIRLIKLHRPDALIIVISAYNYKNEIGEAGVTYFYRKRASENDRREMFSSLCFCIKEYFKEIAPITKQPSIEMKEKLFDSKDILRYQHEVIKRHNFNKIKRLDNELTSFQKQIEEKEKERHEYMNLKGPNALEKILEINNIIADLSKKQDEIINLIAQINISQNNLLTEYNYPPPTK